MTAAQIRVNAVIAVLLLLIVGGFLLAAFERTGPRAPEVRLATQLRPTVPGPIVHPPGATDLVPGLNTNPNNDPLPAAFQYGTGSDAFDGRTGDGSGPEGTQRTAALHDAYVQAASGAQPAAAPALSPPSASSQPSVPAPAPVERQNPPEPAPAAASVSAPGSTTVSVPAPAPPPAQAPPRPTSPGG